MWSHSLPLNNLSDETSSARQAKNSPLRRYRKTTTVFILVFALLSVVLFMLLRQYQASKLASSTPVKTLDGKASSQASPETFLLGAPSSLDNQTPDLKQGQAYNNSTTQVKINGQTVQMPENGVIHKEISSHDGRSSVDISSSSSTNGSSQSKSSISVQVESKGQSDVQIMNSE